MNKQAKQVSAYGLLIALAFIFSYIEAVFPLSLGIPGAKLGLANLVTVVGLYTVGIRGGAVVLGMRIILAGLTFGNASTLFYSLAGGVLSYLLMVLCMRKKWFSPAGVSIVGGISHNTGQLVMAAVLLETKWVLTYLPFLLIAGTLAGTAIGLLGSLIVVRIGKQIKKV